MLRNPFLGIKDLVLQSAIDGIIQNVGDLDRFSIQTVPVDSVWEPIHLGNGDSIFLSSLLLNIIEGPEGKGDLFTIFLKFSFLLLNTPEVLKRNYKMAHIGLVHPLTCRVLMRG
jgi:hypothetical protein